MAVSVIIPWCNRAALELALRENTGRLRGCDAEVIVVNGGGETDRLRDLIGRSGCDRVRLIDLRGMAEFSRSACLNVGVFSSRGDRVFTLDADVILSAPFLEEALAEVQRRECFVSVAEVVETEPEMQAERWNRSSPILRKVITTEVTGERGRTASIQYAVGRDGTRTGSGLMVVRKEHFVAVQGFNSGLTGWGFEDYDFQLRLQLALGIERRSFGQVRHLSHERSGTRESNSRNRTASFRNYDCGNYLGTLDADVKKWRGVAVEETVGVG